MLFQTTKIMTRYIELYDARFLMFKFCPSPIFTASKPTRAGSIVWPSERHNGPLLPQASTERPGSRKVCGFSCLRSSSHTLFPNRKVWFAVAPRISSSSCLWRKASKPHSIDTSVNKGQRYQYRDNHVCIRGVRLPR